jgi:hypothetical protein
MAYDAFRGDYTSDVLKRWKKLEGVEWRSRVFVRLTKIKVTTAISQIEDVYFQGNKVPFSITPTPVPSAYLSGATMDNQVAEMAANSMQDRIDDIFTQGNMQEQQSRSILEKAIYGMSVLKAPVIRSMQVPSYRIVVPGLEQFPGMALTPELVKQFGQYELQLMNQSNQETASYQHML